MKVSIPLIAICTASVIAVGVIATVIIVNVNKKNNTPTISETIKSTEVEYIEKTEESEMELLPGEVLLEEDPQTDAEVESIRGSIYVPEIQEKLEGPEISLERMEDAETISTTSGSGRPSYGISENTSGEQNLEEPTIETANNENALPIDFREN